MFDIQILLSNVKNVWLCSIQATQTLGPLGEALRAEAAEADLAMSLPKLSINFNGFQLFQRIWPCGLCIELLKGSLSIAVSPTKSSYLSHLKLCLHNLMNKHPPKLPASRYLTFSSLPSPRPQAHAAISPNLSVQTEPRRTAWKRSIFQATRDKDDSPD